LTPHASRLTTHGFFVTGTDTGVGKTLIACALLHAFAAAGRRVVGMKPVAAGAEHSAAGLINADVRLLHDASSIAAPLALINPYCFMPPIAPHIAAEQAGVTIALTRIARAFAQLAASADVVIVEGVGGFCVPLNRHEDAADLARYLRLPVILVVGLRLGCLNHALLTAQAIRARGLELAGWVANRVDPAMAVAEENIRALTERLAAPLVGEIEFTVAPDPARIAALLDLSGLI
jgi:dethiobiotin synthetase